MDWHKRYLQQASWTRDLRLYVWQRTGLSRAARVLEVGCGTGAILHDLAPRGAPEDPGQTSFHGLDVSFPALAQCRSHAPHALLTCADAHSLPFSNESFEITFCHFLLLWVRDPVHVLREMSRVTRSGGHVIAFAEPAYDARSDLPPGLARLGELQQQSLIQQGADPTLGTRLGQIFRDAGLHPAESGSLAQWHSSELDDGTFAGEWEVLREDLRGMVSPAALDTWKKAGDQERRYRGRLLHVPTFFAWAQV